VRAWFFARRVRRAAFAVALYQFLALTVSAWMLTRGLEEMIIPLGGEHLGHDWSTASSGDGRLDWAAARLFLEHQSPYTPDGLRFLGAVHAGYGHPPTTPFWFLPFASQDAVIMAQSVALVVLLILLAHVSLCVSELRLPSPLVTTTFVFCFVGSSSWMIEHLHVVQVSEVIAFLYVLAWYALRRGREELAGAAIGLACTIKLFPGVMCVYFLFAGRWRAVAGALAAYLPVAALMTSRFGLASWPMFFSQQSGISNWWMGHIRNASLLGVVLRALTPVCVAHASPSRLSTLLGAACSLALLGAAFLVCRRRLRARADEDLTFALFATISVFVNAWIWEHYRVFLILPFLLVLRAAWARASGAWRGWARDPSPGIELRGMPLAETATPLALGAGLGVVAACLRDRMWDKVQAIDTYLAGGMAPAVRAWLHLRLHQLEIENWLPWPLMIAMLFVVLLPSRHSDISVSIQR
jgi:hypothetical protein